MRRVLIVLASLGIAVLAGAPTAHGAVSQVQGLRVSGGPTWEQWIERDTERQNSLGFWLQTACSAREPAITYRLAPTSGTPAPGAGRSVLHVGIMYPLRLGQQLGGGGVRDWVPYGPVAVPMHAAWFEQGRFYSATILNQVGRRLLAFYVDGGSPLDVVRNWRSVRYTGVLTPAGACAQAGVPTYDVLAPGR